MIYLEISDYQYIISQVDTDSSTITPIFCLSFVKKGGKHHIVSWPLPYQGLKIRRPVGGLEEGPASHFVDGVRHAQWKWGFHGFPLTTNWTFSNEIYPYIS